MILPGKYYKKLLIRNLSLKSYHKLEWCLNKDDVSPKELFELHKTGGGKGRSTIAKYCIQDCELCINLVLMLDIIPNNMGMSNVCSVPLNFIFFSRYINTFTSLFCKLKVRMQSCL